MNALRQENQNNAQLIVSQKLELEETKAENSELHRTVRRKTQAITESTSISRQLTEELQNKLQTITKVIIKNE